MSNFTRRRHQEEGEHENTERWLLTYSDMITLLMAFFILMYTFSRVDAAKLKGVAVSVQKNLGYSMVTMFPTITASPIDGAPLVTKVPPAIVGSTRIIPASYKLAAKNIAQTLQRDGLADQVRVGMDARGMVISLVSGVLFDIGSDKLKSDAKKLLDSVGLILAEVPNELVIEGHTDEQGTPMPSGLSPNWKLSAGRSVAVLEYLVSRGFLTQSKVSLGAFSSNKPLTTDLRISPDERHKRNRRVDIVLVGESPFKTRIDSRYRMDASGAASLDW
ncbi:MAG TPA: flagellar motor protein MotB [Candidatus Ozemobacteraceae bacterium]|nr:flagellar motor protein MotB [Candidatus Ozemobacteraceae bacterium]